VGAGLASALFGIIGDEVARVSDLGYETGRIERDSPAPERDIEEWERRVEDAIVTDEAIRETERRALVLARRGQGIFRDNVRTIDRACRITKVERAEHLIASHVQPWRDSSNEQRLDGENGLLLTPTVDHLFDKGFQACPNIFRAESAGCRLEVILGPPEYSKVLFPAGFLEEVEAQNL
jgi:hypothetical protein